MNVLSLFDGLSGGQIALERAGIKVDNYFASEVDKYAIQVTRANYPDTIQLGDIQKIKACDLPPIQLICGGSPCQGFSRTGKHGKFDDPRSALFWHFKRLLDECKPDYFLLENVRMDKFSEGVISDALGLDPVVINSALVSAQNRVRLYWTNIKTVEYTMFGHLKTDIPQPEDRRLVIRDIQEKEIKPCGKLLHSDNSKINNNGCIQIGMADIPCLEKWQKDAKIYSPDGKCPTLTTMQGGYREPKVGIKNIGNLNGKDQQENHIVGTDGKCPTLLSQSGGVAGAGNYLISDPPYIHWRKLTPRECGRLQTVPEDKIDIMLDTVSNSQTHKLCGNGFTIEVINYIFSFLSNDWKV